MLSAPMYHVPSPNGLTRSKRHLIFDFQELLLWLYVELVTLRPYFSREYSLGGGRRRRKNDAIHHEVFLLINQAVLDTVQRLH